MTPTHTKRLAAKIHQPGGQTEEEAIAAASANLETLRDRTEHELTVTLQQIRELGRALGEPPDPATVQKLYWASNTIIGISGIYGMSGLSSVAYSLCDIIDRMRTARVWNAEAVQIHIDSLILMRSHGTSKDTEQEVLKALRKLLDRIPGA